MRRAEVFEGVRMLKFRSVVGRWKRHELSQVEAAELLGVGERTFRRWCGRYGDEGEAGLLDSRMGKSAANRVPVNRAAEVEALYRTRYTGLTAKHFHDHLCATTTSSEVTPGRRCSCKPAACWRRHLDVVRIAASARAGRWRG